MRLTTPQRLSASEALFAKLEKEPSTFGELWPEANAALGYSRSSTEAPGYRFTDRWLQRQSRAGIVKFTRQNWAVRWSLTEHGRHVAPMNSPGHRLGAAESFSGERWHLNGFNICEVIVIRSGPAPDGTRYIDGRHQLRVAMFEHPDDAKVVVEAHNSKLRG